MYRFKIYRNPNVPSVTGTFSDAVRYYFSLYNFERTITPVWNNLAFKWTRGDRVFFRKELEGEMTLIGEDYQWVLGVQTDASERSKYRAIVIEEKIDGFWVEAWKGFFSVSAGKFDMDNCSATFEKLLVWDKYNVLLENIEREKNLIDVPAHTVMYEKSPYMYDTEIVKETTTYGLATGCELPPASFFEPQEDEIEYGLKYILYSKRVDYIGVTVVSGNTLHQYSKTFEYRRDYVNQVADPGAAWENGGAVSGTNGVIHWVRNYLGSDAPTFITNYYNRYYEDYDCYLRRSVSIADTTDLTEVENERGRLFGGAILHLLEGLPNVNKTYAKSQFLQNTINPITGTTNRMNLLFLFQISDLKETSDPATKGMYSFENIEKWLALIQLYWYIDDDDVLVIEHKKFFDQGLSYSGNVVGIDILSDSEMAKQAKATSKFSYIRDSIQHIDEIKMPYNSDDDFVGDPIVYHGNLVNWGDNGTITHSVNDLSTDLEYIINNEDEVGNDGFVLVSTFIDVANSRYEVYRGNGAITTRLIWNAPLAIANIQDEYWRWGRPTDAGVMNREYVEFDSTEYNFAQEEFKITYCDDLDPYKLVRTEYGYGRIREAVKSLKDNSLTLTLQYSV